MAEEQNSTRKSSQKSSRRDFLLGKSAVEAVDELIDSNHRLDEPNNDLPPKTSLPKHTIRYSRRAMACEFEILVNAGQHQHASEAAIESLDLVDQLEEQLSVFRENSEICQINREAVDEPIEVEARLFELLQTALKLYRQTDGAFDITSGSLSKIWGFYRRQASLPPQDTIDKTLRTIGSHQIYLNPEEQTIQFLQPDVEINLGGIGKGYALDRCGECLTDLNVTDFMIHGGNSSILACGRETPDDESQTGWAVAVMHPLRLADRIATIQLSQAAIGTSGSGTQFFRHAGKRYGHILDPRTGWPAVGVLSSTVVAPTAAVADALATAFYVMGVEAAIQFCQQHSEIALLMTTAGKKQGSLKIHQLGFDEKMLQIV